MECIARKTVDFGKAAETLLRNVWILGKDQVQELLFESVWFGLL